MPVATIYQTDSASGRAYRAGTTRANLESNTGGSTGVTANAPGAGMYRTSSTSYDAIQGFIAFDISPIPNNALVTGVVLKFRPSSVNTSSGATTTLRFLTGYDHGASVTDADLRTRAQVQALTEVGNVSASGLSNGTLASVTLSASCVSPTAATLNLHVNSNLFEDGTAIDVNGGAYVYFEDSINRSYLEITYDEPATGQSFHLPTYDSYVECQSAASATVEAALGTLTLQDPTLPYLYSGVGYAGSAFHAWQPLISFDTSSITVTPLSVALQFKAADDYGMPANKIFHVYAYDFGTADITDFRSRAWVQSATSLGSFTIIQGQTRSTVEEVTLTTSSIVKGGITKFVIVGQDFRDGIWPAASGTTYAMADLNTVESSTAAGYPRLVITAGAPPGSGNPIGSGTFGAIGTGILYVRKDNQWLRID